jgi:hypothetical protein
MVQHCDATPASRADNPGMDAKSTPAPRIPQSRDLRLTFWRVTFIIIAMVEFYVVVQFVLARHAEHLAMRGPCPDECLGTWFARVFWGFAIFAWPPFALIAAGLGRLIANVITSAAGHFGSLTH